MWTRKTSKADTSHAVLITIQIAVVSFHRVHLWAFTQSVKLLFGIFWCVMHLQNVKMSFLWPLYTIPYYWILQLERKTIRKGDSLGMLIKFAFFCSSCNYCYDILLLLIRRNLLLLTYFFIYLLTYLLTNSINKEMLLNVDCIFLQNYT